MLKPKEVEVYSRAIQTEDSATCTSEGTEEEEEPSTVERQTTDIEKKDSVETSEETVAAPSSASEEPTTIIELSEEEKKNVMQSNEFVRFFSKASRRLERALFVGDQWDIMLDYSEADSETTEAKREDKVHLQTTLFDERWCKHRAVTDVTCSPKHADLVAASYSANEAGTHDPDGVVCVWSVQNMLQRPEFVFNCQSPVMSCLLPKYHPTLLVGGTYSGQIVLWDTRARNTPVQRTPLSSIGHTHPVYSLSVVGTQNANNLVSVSTDGRMCVWSFDSLLQPLEVLELRNRQSKSVTGSGNVAPTCIDFPDGEVNQFFTGSEEGVAYQAYRHGSKSGVDEQYCGHKGPITGISFHPAQGSIDFSDLFLTSSMDWSCKLWSRKDTKPLKSFEDTGDYVYDVCWSPTHPALFASVDGTGSLLLWNLNEDTEAPVVRQPIGSRSLNCLCWTHSGKKIAVGDSAGVLSILDLGEMGTPRVDDWERMQATLSEFAVAPQGQEGPSSDFVV
ncbi:Cytoplasmic dynein 1 intermediate chain 2 [Balamuthia mandrillaris]